ncbi:MAG: cobalamin-dependent protein, partial [Candidatus Aminicenantes bacterium]|nr:cobalamin-dependent protein [Candidatus Aminicenantes bacterium]
MKWILIDPPRRAVNIIQDEVILKATEKASRFPPVGLAYLAGCLQSNGVEVQIIDAKSLNLPCSDICEIVEKEKPDIVGVTVFTSNLKSSLAICQEINKAYPPAKIVVGGAHIHPQHREVIEKPYIDFCVRGEGEETVLELTEALSNGKDLEQVKGLTFKKEHNIIVTPE